MYKIKMSTSIFGGTTIIKINDDGSTVSFCENTNNIYYQEYLHWLSEGNIAEVVA